MTLRDSAGRRVRVGVVLYTSSTSGGIWCKLLRRTRQPQT